MQIQFYFHASLSNRDSICFQDKDVSEWPSLNRLYFCELWILARWGSNIPFGKKYHKIRSFTIVTLTERHWH